MQRFVLDDLVIYNSIYEYINSNMYVIIEKDEALVVDPHECKDVLCLLEERHDVSKVTILLTHEHPDHISGVYWLQERFLSELICSKTCADYISNPKNVRPILITFVLDERDKLNGTDYLRQFKDNYEMRTYQADVTFEEHLSYKWMSHHLDFYPIQGHSEGSCIIMLNRNVVFTGDSLMKDDPIITRFPGGNRKLYQIKTLPFLESILDSETKVFPGHGIPFILKDIMKEGKIYVQFR